MEVEVEVDARGGGDGEVEEGVIRVNGPVPVVREGSDVPRTFDSDPSTARVRTQFYHWQQSCPHLRVLRKVVGQLQKSSKNRRGAKKELPGGVVFLCLLFLFF